MIAAAVAAGPDTYRTSSTKAARKPVASEVRELPMTSASGSRTARSATTAIPAFSLVGITWATQPADTRSADTFTARVRTRSDGRWTGWQPLQIADDHGPDSPESSRDRSGTEPLWVGTADGIQAELSTATGAAVTGARVVLVDPGTSREDDSRSLETMTAADHRATVSPYPMPSIVTRRGWGANESLRGFNGTSCTQPKYTSTIRAAFVHHTAGSNNYTKSQSASLVRGVYSYHVKGRGWCDVGYNFLVDKYGQVFEGRFGGMHVPVLGAHTGSFNGDSFGISLMGNFETVQPTAAILERTAQVIAWKLDGYYRDPRGTVVLKGKRLNVISGHRDTKQTACPGKNVYARMPQIRTRVNALMGGTATEIYKYSRQLGGEAKLGPAFWGEHAIAGGGRSTWFAQRDLYWSSAAGANSVYGSFRARHRQFGHGNGVLGGPTVEERNGWLAGSRVQDFRTPTGRTAIYWSRATAPQALYGAIFGRYALLGAERSRLGLPTTSPYKVTGGVSQKFRGGSIRWYRVGNRTEVRYA